MSDLFKTQLQETGRAPTLGLPLSEVLADIEELGIDPALCILGAGTVVVFEATYVPHDPLESLIGDLWDASKQPEMPLWRCLDKAIKQDFRARLRRALDG